MKVKRDCRQFSRHESAHRECRPRVESKPLANASCFCSYVFTCNLPTVYLQCIVVSKGLRDSVRHDDDVESNVGRPVRGKERHDPAEAAHDSLCALRLQALED